MRFSRRQMVLGLLGFGAGSKLGLGSMAFAASNGPRVTRPKKSAFPPDRRRTLAVAAERILPGATEAGVMDYIDYWMLREPFSAFVQPLFKAGAGFLEQQARAKHGKSFVHCKPEQQDAMIATLHQGTTGKRFNGRGFFEHLVRFTMEGFLGDPKYGGNRNEVGWKFIGRKECWWQPRQLNLLLNPDKGLPY
ncbi:MAG: gluconate 2-dehydrogenase subunit 3 family protein [Deltaproteobacteria bacterium]|nr:gluconate 2-dehydrogenase subunit 3 family protein [Deltaproteobacteria bacterium]